MADINSPYYPYEKPTRGFNTLKGIEKIPEKIVMYLLDLPDANGYEPVDDNSRPRVRLIKYLYYDEPNPLSKPLPTPEQKLSLLYQGENAMLPTKEDREKHPKGYRIMAQNYTEPSELDARVMLKCYMARAIAKSDYMTSLGIDFETSINYAMDNTMKDGVYSKGYAIFQCLVEALHGVNITGVGTVHFNKSVHGDCGFTLYHTEGTTWYFDCFMAIQWQETTDDDVIMAYEI